MATWKDGAAYAPVERPDGFATPVADPLPASAPYRAETPGPMRHPQGFEPLPPQPSLAEIGPRAASSRDPRDAFEVASSLVTAGPDAPHSGPRDPRTPFPTTAQSALDTSPPPPTGAPLDVGPADAPPGVPTQWPVGPPPSPAPAPQSGAIQPHRETPGGLSHYPPPQMPQWQPPPRQPAVDPSLRTQARVAGALCLIGFFATGTASFMLLVAGVMGLRTKPLTRALGYMALSSGAGGLLLQLMLGRYDWMTFRGLWGLLALGFAIAFLVSSQRDPRR